MPDDKLLTRKQAAEIPEDYMEIYLKETELSPLMAREDYSHLNILNIMPLSDVIEFLIEGQENA
jgi:hypothetical protein